jgi:hypothetical protein
MVFCFSFLFASCFGGNVYRRGSVMGYDKGLIKTQGGSFRIGVLPSDWRSQKIRYRAVLFVHRDTHESITIDSWCQGAADDGSLESLTDQLYLAMNQSRITHKEFLKLDGRAVLHASGFGSVDGKAITMATYVLKMNACVFDFVYVAESADQMPGVHLDDFDAAVQEFHYIKGPRIL